MSLARHINRYITYYNMDGNKITATIIIMIWRRDWRAVKMWVRQLSLDI